MGSFTIQRPPAPAPPVTNSPPVTNFFSQFPTHGGYTDINGQSIPAPGTQPGQSQWPTDPYASQRDFNLGGFQPTPPSSVPDINFKPQGNYGSISDPPVTTQPQPYQQGPGGVTAAPAIQGGQAQSDPKEIALQYAQSLGSPSPENIQKTADYMKSLGFNVQANPGSDGFFLNGVGVDMVSNFHGQGPSNWQFLPDSPISGSGGASAGSGYGGVQTLGGMAGGSGLTPTQQIEQTPGYQFSVDQAKGAIEHSAAARGTLLSGGLMKNLGSYIANAVAGPAYQNQVNNLYRVSDLGFNAANQTGGFGSSFAGGASGALGGIGDATANGIVGASNAGANATNQVLNGIGQIQWPWNKPKVPTPGLPAPTTTSQYPGKVPGDG